MIDFATTYLPKLDVTKEQGRLWKSGALAEDKDGNEYIRESQLAEYLAKRFSCFVIKKTLYLYNQCTGAYEPIEKELFLHVLVEYFRVVYPAMVHMVKDSTVWYKLLTFAQAKKGYTPNSQYVAFSNVTIDILNRKTKKHSPKHFVTNVIPHEYDRKATCPVFDEALNTIFAGDMDTIAAFWEMAGYLFYYGTDYPLQKIFIFLGYGSNGKSLVLDVLRYMLGEGNCAGARLDEISSEFGASHFYGKMLNISPETELTKPANTALLKSITGGDAVSTNMKHSPAFSAKHYTKFIIAANNLFPMTDSSHGMFRRLQIFPFNQTFVEPPANDTDRVEGVLYSDKELLSKIKPEISGIINRALKGLFRLQKNNWTLTYSAACQGTLTTVTKAYAPFTNFVKEHMVVTSGYRQKRADAITAFYEYQQSVQLGQTFKSYSREEVGTYLLQELQKLYPKAGIVLYKYNGTYVFKNVKLV